MNTFHLIVASPDGRLFDGEAVCVFVRGAEGELAVMAGHIPFVTSLKPCECRIELDDGQIKKGHTEGGLLTVGAESTTLLSSSFVWN